MVTPFAHLHKLVRDLIEGLSIALNTNCISGKTNDVDLLFFSVCSYELVTYINYNPVLNTFDHCFIEQNITPRVQHEVAYTATMSGPFDTDISFSSISTQVC